MFVQMQECAAAGPERPGTARQGKQSQPSSWLLAGFSCKVISHQRSARNTPPNSSLLATKKIRIPSKEYQQRPDFQKLCLLGFRLLTAVI